MPSNFMLKTANQLHRSLLTITGGKLGWTTAGMPVIELVTIGRKSGQERTAMLTIPWQDDETLAIVASAGGNEHHPAWFLNLSENPSVTVRTKQGERQMTARVLKGEERSRLWSEITGRYKNYAAYQAKTDREIPIVLLGEL